MGKMDFASAFASFDRGTIASAVEVLVAVLDTMDGDIDVEPNGDELDGTAAEDDFYPHGAGREKLRQVGEPNPADRFFCPHGNWRGEPGCPISDPDSAVDDKGCDDTNDDREHDEDIVPCYGLDQTAGIVSNERGLERVQEFPCQDI